MYNKHFRFREKPFKLVPNPDFLYLSKIHEIALAHLTYAVEEGDGFVVITGEVGTGKTTLCRIFLEKLDENVESAYIFNPKLDSVELLTAICNEFGMRTEQTSLKKLLDELNGYLITQSKAHRKVILLIDEAQNLSIENLEMVRMISNLETTRHKLIQIILVGQPELGDKLDSYELRQLSQRISLSTHLTPLDYTETVGYIRHRLNIAAQRQVDLFTPGAFRLIYKYSSGIPRNINIACDRALLNAYGLGSDRVNATIAQMAVDELIGRGRQLPGRPKVNPKKLAAVALSVFIVAGLVSFVFHKEASFRHPSVSPSTAHQPASASTKFPIEPHTSIKTYKIKDYPGADTPSAVESSTADHTETWTAGALAHTPATASELSAIINALAHQTSRLNAVASILACWGQPAPVAAQLPNSVSDEEYFDIAAHQYGLRMYAVISDWAMIKKMNLPAIVALRKGVSGSVAFVSLVGWRQGHVQLAFDSDHRNRIQVRLEALLPFLEGPMYVYWNNATQYDELITHGSTDSAILAAKQLLRQVGYADIDFEPIFDDATRQAVLDFQIRHHLEPDGLIGPLTKIFLIDAADIVDTPKLTDLYGGSGA
ncbi:MAG: AAA family ATPase [Desulfatitalea sp.]|nr:AAA family ATPase [Desulfatitalea sp.]NNK02048.1 AAA family ATPase [Desulfatitalea sp.]